MISRLEIENFRGFRHLTMDGLKRITLISGRNNIGKSTILEALFLFMDHTSQNSFIKLSSYRGTPKINEENLWKPLFTDMDLDKNICITVGEDEKGHRADLVYSKDTEYVPFSPVGVSDNVISNLRSATRNAYSLAFRFSSGDYEENGHFSTDGNNILADVRTNLDKNEKRPLIAARLVSASVMRMQDTTVTDIGKLEILGKKEKLITILKKLDSSIEDVVTISLHGVPQLYIRSANQLLPIEYAGDGVVKLLNIVTAIMLMQDGLVLFDELETGFHYSMYEKLWKIIDEASYESNCQVLATTHSYELIAAAQDGLIRGEDFVYFRLGKGKSGTEAFDYGFKDISGALQSNMEVR